MIITKQKQFKDILAALKKDKKIFIVGCGECASTCKTGGQPEIMAMKELLEKEGKVVTGWDIPKAPCVAAQIKMTMAKKKKEMEEADSYLVMACGLGVQSVQDNDRKGKRAHTANDTLCGALLDKTGVNFYEYCSACGNCVLDLTSGICPITRCPKGLLNGPCGGVNKGKCEVDPERDCTWVLIYKNLKERNELELIKAINPPKDFSVSTKPHHVSI